MKTLSLPLDQWSEATIQQIVAEGAEESTVLEFKRELPFKKSSDRREVAKDISAMANGSGGWIIYGIDEAAGASGITIASSAVPMVSGTTAPPDPASWIDNVLHGHLTPRPVGVRFKEIASSGGGVYVVVQVAASDELHMLVREHRYYRRSAKGARPMTEPEVRDAYDRICRGRAVVAEYVARLVDAELASAPRVSFFVALVPHTMGERIDPTTIDHGDSAFEPLKHFYRARLEPSAAGLEVLSEDYYRFRLRRDAAISIAFHAGDAERWRPARVLRETLAMLLVARALWPQLSVVESATLAVRSRFGTSAHADTGGRHWLSPPILGEDIGFDMPVPSLDLRNEPERLAKAVIDRIFQAMGKPISPYFTSDCELRAGVFREDEELHRVAKIGPILIVP